MKKRTITALLSIVLAVTTLTGCSMPEKVLSLIGKSDSEISKTEVKEDENVEESSEASKKIPEDDIKENLTEVGEEDIQDIFEDGFINVPASLSTKAPTFKIATKRVSIKYDGDAKFDETNENNKDYSNGVLFEGYYQYLLMDDACRDDYPLLYEAINSDSEESMSKADNYGKSMADDARNLLEEAAEGGYSFFGPFSYEDFVSVTRSDDVVLSVYNYSSDFEGGAHGMFGASGDNYDVKTGEKLDISDVIDIDKEKLDEILKSELLEIAAENDTEFTYLDNLYDLKFNPESDYENGVYEYGYKWYFSYDGLHVVFNPYVLGTYGDGMQDVVIGYDEYPGTINEKYIPESNIDHIYKDRIYFVQDKYDYDYNSDLHFRYTPFESEYYEDDMVAEKFELVKDGKTAEIDYGFYVNDEKSFDIYRVVTKDGREFVYLFIPQESDYCQLIVFDITDDVKVVGEQGYHEIYDSNRDGFLISPVLTDPYDMHLGNVGNSFGTYTYYGDYEIGSDGLPRLTSDVYHLVWKSEDAYSKTEIKADEVDIDGNTLESGVTISRGEHFVPFRTDKESYMDFYLDDGRIIRLTYTNFEYPATIPEGNIDDLFEGIIYAG